MQKSLRLAAPAFFDRTKVPLLKKLAKRKKIFFSVIMQFIFSVIIFIILAKALIKNLLVTDPCQRLTIEQLMQSEWITHCIIAPKTPLHTSKMLTEEQMQDINVFILSFFQNF